ncbi:MAG: AlpA family phage regulatory protein [Mesorhizobium sp.]|nr:MAG: AlpA family phage regulatory protein [Mesorhizobium sp.]
MTERLLNKKEVQTISSISPAHIDRLEKAGAFPKRVRLGPGRVAWAYSEVLAWVQAQIAKRDALAASAL